MPLPVSSARRRAFIDFGCCGLILLPLLILPFVLLFLPIFAIVGGLLLKPRAPKPKTEEKNDATS